MSPHTGKVCDGVSASPNEADLCLIADSIPHIVFLTDVHGALVYVNRQGTEYTGLPAERRDSAAWLELVHADDRDAAWGAWEHAVHTETACQLDYRLRRADGVFRWHHCQAQPLRDDRGHVLQWLGTCTDIEDRVRAEAESADSLALLDTLLASAPVGLGFADREFRYVRVNPYLAAMNGIPVEAHAGRPVAEVVPHLWPQIEPVYRTVLETGRPVVNQEMFYEDSPGRVRYWLTTCFPVRVKTDLAGVGIVRVDITDRKEHERHRNELMRASIAAIATMVEIRDPYTAGHQRRVADVSAAIAGTMGLDGDAVEGIWLAASIHDIGKIGIPSEILSRSGPLVPVEFELVKTHARAGHDIVAGIAFPWPVADMILQHHERLDGSGYPDGRGGDEIVIGARIIAVADTVEAMASHRPYRPARGLRIALDTLSAGRGTKYDTDVVDAFLAVVDAGTLGPSSHEWWGHPGRP